MDGIGIRVESGKVYIERRAIINCIFLLILLFPDDFFRLTSIYNSKTPSFIMYKWLDFDFDMIQLTIIIAGLVVSVYRKYYAIYIVAILMLLRELYFLAVGQASIFTDSSYEIYLTLLTGVMFAILVIENNKTLANCEKFFVVFAFSNLLTVFIQVFSNINKITNRYNASNLDVGNTAVLACLLLLYYFCDKTKSRRELFVAFSAVVLYLTGSRINIILCVAFVLFIMMMDLLKKFSNGKLVFKSSTTIMRVIYGGVFLIGVVAVLLLYSDDIITSILNSRVSVLFDWSSISADSSTQGRLRSIVVGIELIKEYKFGISGYFTNLQLNMMRYNYPTFPHSGIITNWLLLGPIILAVFGLWTVLVVKNYKRAKKWAMIVGMLMVSLIIGGGPVVNSKIMFMYVFITIIAIRSYREGGIENV